MTSKQSLLIIFLVFSLGLNAGLLLRTWDSPAAGQGESPANSAVRDGAQKSLGDPEPSSQTVAAPPFSGRRAERIGPVQMAERLGLEGERRLRFRETKNTYFRRTAEKRRQVRELQAQLRQLLSSPGVDRAQTEPLLAELAKVHGELEGLFVDHFLATRNLLDAEQQALYQELLMEQLDRRSRRSPR